MSILGDLTPADFLSRVWQRETLMLQGALPDYVSAISPEQLAGLSLDSEVESRLIRKQDTDWLLQHGPFEEATFLDLPDRDWTLLGQAVDLWVDEVSSLFEAFDFLPRWRFDDIMVSYATPGGGAGPHFDQYDVFLVQVTGERHWRLGGEVDDDTQLVEGSEMRLVWSFEEHESWVMKPGDVLYVPPGVIHWGEAVTESLTYSVGFRSPSFSDMLGDLAIELMAQGRDGVYRDPTLLPSDDGLQISDAVVEEVQAQLRAIVDDPELVADWFARFMTQPRYPEAVEVTDEKRVARTRWGTYENGERVDE